MSIRPKRWRTALVAFAALPMFAVACSSDDSAKPTGADDNSCIAAKSLVYDQEAADLLGGASQDPQDHHCTSCVRAALPTECTWVYRLNPKQLDEVTLLLEVQAAAWPSASWSEYKTMFPDATPLPGLGDDAFTCSHCLTYDVCVSAHVDGKMVSVCAGTISIMQSPIAPFTLEDVKPLAERMVERATKNSP